MDLTIKRTYAIHATAVLIIISGTEMPLEARVIKTERTAGPVTLIQMDTQPTLPYQLYQRLITAYSVITVMLELIMMHRSLTASVTYVIHPEEA
jgi:hypothetical protein